MEGGIDLALGLCLPTQPGCSLFQVFFFLQAEKAKVSSAPSCLF